VHWPRPALKILHCIAYRGRWKAGSAEVPLCHPAYGLQKAPLVGRPISGSLRMLISMSYDAYPQWRVLDNFDWYSSYHHPSEHTYEEVFRWFESCGPHNLQVAKVPISVRGTMSATRTILNPEPEQAVERCAG
jgi:hypothetical protein